MGVILPRISHCPVHHPQGRISNPPSLPTHNPNHTRLSPVTTLLAPSSPILIPRRGNLCGCPSFAPVQSVPNFPFPPLILSQLKGRAVPPSPFSPSPALGEGWGEGMPAHPEPVNGRAIPLPTFPHPREGGGPLSNSKRQTWSRSPLFLRRQEPTRQPHPPIPRGRPARTLFHTT